MGKPGRILYMAPDLDHPSGGVRVIYSHVRCLRDNGYDAFVVHVNPGHVHRWAGIKVPVLAFNAGLALTPSDTLVVPEGCVFTELGRLERIRKIAFVQSVLYAFDGPGGASAWAGAGFSGALCCSGVTAEFAREVLGIARTFVVPNCVEEVFRPGGNRIEIAFMPRKNPAEAVFVQRALSLKRPDLAGTPWVPIQGLDMAGVAGILGGAALFLSLCLYEGFNLPPLEAMACGAVPVGSHGYGGREYATTSNGLWCEHGDLPGLVRQLERGLDMALAGSPEFAALRAHGLETAARFSPRARDEALLTAWSALLEDEA